MTVPVGGSRIEQHACCEGVAPGDEGGGPRPLRGPRWTEAAKHEAHCGVLYAHPHGLLPGAPHANPAQPLSWPAAPASTVSPESQSLYPTSPLCIWRE